MFAAKRRKFLGIGAGIVSVAWWFTRETIQHWFFDKVIHFSPSDSLSPYIVEYGPPLALGLICLWLLFGDRLEADAASPMKRENMPTAMWRYGYGGAGANTPEYNRRLWLLTQIRNEYKATFPDDAPFIDAGVDPVPINWIIKRLEEIGEQGRVELGDGGYILPPLQP